MKQILVRLKFSNKYIEAPGFLAKPGLAVHKEYDFINKRFYENSWIFTHVKSGLRINVKEFMSNNKSFLSKEKAVEWLKSSVLNEFNYDTDVDQLIRSFRIYRQQRLLYERLKEDTP